MYHDGKRFAQDAVGFIEQNAKARARRTSRLMLAPLGDSTDKEAYEFFKSSCKANGIGTMIRLAHTKRGIPAKMVDFDRDPLLLNVIN